MNEKTIKPEIMSGLRNGKSKDEIYEENSNTIDDQLLRRILAAIPSPDVKIKFRVLHKFVCWFWVLIFSIELLGSVEMFFHFDIKVLISLAISAYILIQLWKFNGDIYLPAIVWLIFSIFNTFKELVNLSTDDPDYDGLIIIFWGFILFLLATIMAMWIVRKNVFGYYNWFKPALDYKNRIIFQEE